MYVVDIVDWVGPPAWSLLIPANDDRTRAGASRFTTKYGISFLLYLNRLTFHVIGYLPKHKAVLRHVNLLLFARQIADGMTYLEQQRWVCIHPL